MSEIDQGKIPTPSSIEQVRQLGQSNVDPNAPSNRAIILKRLILIGAVFGLIAIGLHIPIYIETNAWQMLAVIAGLVIGIFCLIPAYSLVRRENLEIGGYWIIATLFIVYGVGELVWADGTFTQIASFLMLMVLMGSTFRPRRKVIWIAAAVFYLLYTLLINWFEPLPRYPILDTAPQTQYINIPLALMVIWQIARAFWFRAIRTRLLFTSFTTVSLTTIAIIAGSYWISIRNGQQMVIDRLELATFLKQNEIEVWMDGLLDDLTLVMTNRDFLIDSRTLLAQDSPDLLLQSSLRSYLRNRLQDFQELFLINPEGLVILSTVQTGRSLAGHNLQDEFFFQTALEDPVVQAKANFPTAGEISILIAHPLPDPEGGQAGMLVGRTDSRALNAIMTDFIGLGETGEMYLVNPEQILLTDSIIEDYRPGKAIVENIAVNSALQNPEVIKGIFDNYRGVKSLGVYDWLPELQAVMVAEQSLAEAPILVNQTILLYILFGLAVIIPASFVSLLIARSISNPLNDLAETAAKIADGDLERSAPVVQVDEIRRLAQAFNSMTLQLREMISSLEERVESRTQALEQRSTYLAASAEVGRAASSILDVDELIQNTINLIREKFDLYYTGIFLLDETEGWAVLRAGTGHAGSIMLSNGHKLAVGGDSMIGQCVALSEARIALDVGEEAIHFDNPLLPETRSECALPLISRGRTLGAITVHSDKRAAFDEDIIATLQTMADQVALAINNAYLFAEARQALEATRRAYGDTSRADWVEYIKSHPSLGYRSDIYGTSSAKHIWHPEMEYAYREKRPIKSSNADRNAQKPLAIPIKVRNNVIGVLYTYKDEGAAEWGQEEIDLIQALTDQIGLALDSAQLFIQTQQRAIQEQLTAEATSRMRETLDIETILKTAAMQMRKALDLSEVEVRMGVEPSLDE